MKKLLISFLFFTLTEISFCNFPINDTIKFDKEILINDTNQNIIIDEFENTQEFGGISGDTDYEYEYTNSENLIGKNITSIYTSFDSFGNKKNEYGTFNSSVDLAMFKPLGVSITLLIFSFYLFFVATKLYHQYFDKKLNEQILNNLFYLVACLLIIGWSKLVLDIKGIPFKFCHWELLQFPNQFILGILLSTSLLLSVGIFRFSIIAFIHNPIDDENVTKHVRFSYVGFIFGTLGFIANVYTLWFAFN
jgi:hypothetical protein